MVSSENPTRGDQGDSAYNGHHSCESGGGRRSHLRGVYDVGKRWLIQLAARNLGVVIRSITGVGTPRAHQAEGSAAWLLRGARAALIRLQSRVALLIVHLFPIADHRRPIFQWQC